MNVLVSILRLRGRRILCIERLHVGSFAGLLLVSLLLSSSVFSGAFMQQQVKVNPNGVNVNASGATVVFLTFGPLTNFTAGEACWCGELISAAPDRGFKCDPATLFGCLPARFDQSTRSGGVGFTDIMSIPPSVPRRAYQAAQDGATSSFFYVRRFINTAGGPDEYVNVTCRMSGGGARTPFALTDVKLSFAGNKPVFFVRPGEKVPAIRAEIAYNGTGRLKGRWEVVLPGDQGPSVRDLLTEASLPVEERAQQRRFTRLSTFNVFLPPGSKYSLAGPDIGRLPNQLEGPYLVLLRIEATDDKEADSSLAVVGEGPGVVHGGAVAGFPMPPLRYYVGSGPDAQQASKLALLLPSENDTRALDKPLDFSWAEAEQAALYRLQVTDGQSTPILGAIVLRGVGVYRAPSWLIGKVARGELRWRVAALDSAGKEIGVTNWRSLTITSR